MKPIYEGAKKDQPYGLKDVHEISTYSVEFTNWLMPRVFDELVNQKASSDLWVRLENLLLEPQTVGQEVANILFDIDEANLKSLVSNLPNEIQEMIPNLVAKSDL